MGKPTFSAPQELTRVSPLIIDLGIASVTPRQYRDLPEVLDDRHGQGAALITSQLPVEDWHQIVGATTVADTIMDRLAHIAYRIAPEGESIRKLKTPGEPKEKTANPKTPGSR